jgi:hypothetical protein
LSHHSAKKIALRESNADEGINAEVKSGSALLSFQLRGWST